MAQMVKDLVAYSSTMTVFSEVQLAHCSRRMFALCLRVLIGWAVFSRYS